MKKKFLILFSILFIFTLSVFGCGSFSLSGGPSLTETVYGNGGTAVVKGNYLYFSNAYIDYNNIGNNDNKFDRDGTMQKNYGIYRTKLNASGVVDVNDKGVPKNAELLVPQVSGYEKSGIYICGEYLYYTTPYSGYKTGESNLTKGLLRFERVKLNGSDHLILSEGEYTVDCEYSINYVNGVTYITILSNGKIDVIKSKSNGDKSSYTLAENVVSMCVEKQETLVHNKSTANVNKYVYYTRTSESNSKNSLFRKSFENGTEENIIVDTSDSISLVAVKNNRFYYTQNDILKSTSFNNDEVIYSSTAFSKEASTGVLDYIVLNDSYGYGLDRGVVAVYYDGTNYALVLFNNGNPTSIGSATKQIDIKFTVGNEVYYKIAEDSKLYAVNIETAEKRVVLDIFDAVVAEGDEETSTEMFDYDENRVFYFSTAENSNGKLKYLHIALLDGNFFKDAEGNSVGNYIGVLDSSDVK